ncbi:MAG: DNA-protecting protein DprA [Firmicutes bacterium]|nr:DNA-protecting protein DprA [Bacillota bacterium]
MKAQMYLWGLSLLPHIGSITTRRLVEAMGSEEAAFHASLEELQAYGCLSPNQAEAVVEARSALDVAGEWERLAKRQDVGLVTWLDDNYPQRLLEIYDPPPVLYYRGAIECLAVPCVAIVGRRRASPRGLGWARRLARALGAAGITVVSGLAMGIDAAAHTACLETGRTAGVLGTGLDVVYPRCNQRLYEGIPASGVLVTPFPLGMKPQRGNFPARNRIISGLSLGVIVVEAGERSGALITAMLALEQNRDVYAVPGDPADSGAAGPNKLIQQGAKLITGPEDVLEEMCLSGQLKLPLQGPGQPRSPEVASFAGDSRAHKLLESLARPLHVDELAMMTGLPVSVINSSLVELELAGLVEELSAGVFQRVS